MLEIHCLWGPFLLYLNETNCCRPSAIIIYYVLAITIVNQLCKKLILQRGAGCGTVEKCNLNLKTIFMWISFNGKVNWLYDIYAGQLDEKNWQYRTV